MDPFNALCATYRLILFGIDITQVPSTIRQSLELVRTCYQDVQHLIELRQTYLSLLEKRPHVLDRVNSIISAATQGLAEVCAIVEKCRPEAHRGRTSFRCRFQWIFFDEKDFRAHEPVIARHHAAVLAELNFLRQIVRFTPFTPVVDGKGEAGEKRKGTIFFDNVALWGDLFGGPSDGEPGALSAQMTSLAIGPLSNANLGVNRASLSRAESTVDRPPAYQGHPRTLADPPAAFHDSKELNIIPKSTTATEPILPEPNEGNEGPVTSRTVAFDPHNTTGRSTMFGGGPGFPPSSPSSSSSAWLSPQLDTYRRQVDLPQCRPVPSVSSTTYDQGGQEAGNQWQLKSQYSFPVGLKTWQEPPENRDYGQVQPLATSGQLVGSAQPSAEGKAFPTSGQSRDSHFYAEMDDSNWLFSPSPDARPDRDTASQRMAHARVPSPLVPSRPTTSSFKTQRSNSAQPVSSIPMSQYMAPDLGPQTTFTSQYQWSNLDLPVPSASGLGQIHVQRGETPNLIQNDLDGLSIIPPGIIYSQMGGKIANNSLTQRHNTPWSATPSFLLPGIPYPPQAQVAELPGAMNIQASHNPQDQQTHYEPDIALSELEASPKAMSTYYIYELPGS